MKKTFFIALLLALIVSAMSMPQQSGGHDEGSSMEGMMGSMMGVEKGEDRRGGMKDMMKQMMGRMSEMMYQCSSMMASKKARAGKSEPDQQK